MSFLSSSVTSELRDAHLDRLGLEAEPPSRQALRRLHRRHVERVPYETLWIHAGETWGIEPADAITRIARHRRGGYCYHVNGAFGLLLRSLNYSVRAHIGAVHGADGRNDNSAANHPLLTVDGCPPTTTLPVGGTWREPPRCDARTPPAQRTVYFVSWEDLSERDIATLLQIAPGTVRRRAHRARHGRCGRRSPRW